ncbi:MAG TPA: 50S ribosomal protein L29 [Candidatus Paceibacterota bacterium]|nr:50S ribosomal protein L29 [Candidatus Paceibacterota bacterium]
MANELKKETPESLKKVLADKREALRLFRFEGAGSRRRNVREGRELRRDIARVLTELRARDLPAGKAGIAAKAKVA